MSFLQVYNSEPLGLNDEHGGNQYSLLKIAKVLEAYKMNFLPRLLLHIPNFDLLQSKNPQKYAVHKTTKFRKLQKS